MSEALKQIKAQILDGSQSVTIQINAFEKICHDYEKLKAELKQVIEIGVEGQREINRKAHAEIEKLKAENAGKSIQISGMETEINRLAYELDKSRDSHMKIIAKLTKQNEIMKKALEFYADGNNWSTINNMANVITYDRLEHDKDLGDGTFLISEETDDKDVSGKRARLALQECEGI